MNNEVKVQISSYIELNDKQLNEPKNQEIIKYFEEFYNKNYEIK